MTDTTQSSTPKWIAALGVTAVIAAGAGWFVADRSQSDDLGDPVAATSTAAPAATDASTEDPSADEVEPSWLFSSTAGGGTFATDADGTSTLTLTAVDPEITAFTDRPVRDTAVVATDQLTEAWPTMFADSDPNAVLVTRAADGTASTYVLTLSDPTISGTGLSFRAVVVEGQDHSAELPGSTRTPAVAPPATFGASSLFVDNVGRTPNWICTDGKGNLINPPAPIPYHGEDQAGLAFEAQCHQKGGIPSY
ncbi:MAG: hypothetical protein ACK4V6_14535 [Microthrixaceae bacterium]